MNKSFLILTLATVLLFNSPVIAADKAVVIPLFRCSGGLTDCTGKCLDTMNNPSFCGNCTTDCGAGNFCDAGVCKFPAGSTCTTHGECVSGKCVDSECNTGKIVFISSKVFNGNLGGLTGADQKCNSMAAAAGLPGTYKAWLSASGQSPFNRFTTSENPYFLPNGVLLALGWTDLIDGGDLMAMPNIDENNQVRISHVWTNTWTDGKPHQIGDHCDDWADGSPKSDGVNGESGYVDYMDRCGYRPV